MHTIKLRRYRQRLKDLLRKVHEYSDCSHKGCRNEDGCQNVGIYVAGLMKRLTIEVRTDIREGLLRKKSANKGVQVQRHKH